MIGVPRLFIQENCLRKEWVEEKENPLLQIEVKQFIKRAQDLCRDSIMKVLEDGKFPDWNSLILSGEDEQESS